MWIVCGCGQLYLDCKIAYLWHNWYYYLDPLCASAKDIYWLTIGLGGSRPTITSVSDRDGLWPCTGSDCTYPKIYFLQTFYLPTRFAILGPPTLSKMY